MAGTRPRMSGNVSARLTLEPGHFKSHKAALKELERAVRKEIIEEALMAGGTIIHAAAESRAPGPLEIQLVGGRTLRKKVDPRMAQVVKANAKLVAIGPSKKKWYYRFREFGATKHDINVRRVRALKFRTGGADVFAGSASRTGGVQKRPFLRPAVDSKGESAVKEMGRVLDREIKKAARG